MAREVAREADEADARALQQQEDARAGEQIVRGELGFVPVPVVPFDENDPAVLAAVARQAADPGPAGLGPGPPPPAPAVAAARRGRGRGNPFRPVAGRDVQGAAVRAHERGGGGIRGRPAGFNAQVGRHAENALQEHAREEAELQRFVELALRDEEDGWDSDELGDDEEFVIR